VIGILTRLWGRISGTSGTPRGSTNEPWVILTRRYGGDTRSPSPAQLTDGVAELYHENIRGMTEGSYAEHGAASLRFGYDDGPMYVLEISRFREVRLEEWADQDYEQELAPPRRMREVPEEHAVQLWNWLATGQIDRLRSQSWK
jgi:hypothetical protein